MTAFHTVLVIVCVLAICIGQVLFKYVGLAIQDGRALFESRVIVTGFLAFGIYGAATVLWIYLLRHVPLSKAYPYMALSFVIVPLFSFFLFEEKLSFAYLGGIALIFAGVVVVTKLS